MKQYDSAEDLLQKVLERLDVIIKRLPKSSINGNAKFEFIDNSDLIKILKISTKTAQNWRDNGMLKFSKIGAKIYYRLGDLEQMMMENFNKKLSIDGE